jgi:hypothetical protein
VGADIGRAGTYTKSGYNRSWEGLAAPSSVDTARCDASSVSDYCYHATPLSALTGVRGFMGAAAGAIYFTPDGTAVVCPVSGSSVLFLE